MLALPAHGAHFRCVLIREKVKHAICEDPAIAAENEEMSRLLGNIKQSQLSTEEFWRGQAAWLKSTETCAENNCLLAAFRDRIDELSIITHEHEPLVETVSSAAEPIVTATPARQDNVPEASHAPQEKAVERPQQSVAIPPPNMSAPVMPPTSQTLPTTVKPGAHDLLSPQTALVLVAGGLLSLIAAGFYFHAFQFDRSNPTAKSYWVRFFFLYLFWLAGGVLFLLIALLKALASAKSSASDDTYNVKQSSSAKSVSSNPSLHLQIQTLPRGGSTFMDAPGGGSTLAFAISYIENNRHKIEYFKNATAIRIIDRDTQMPLWNG